MAAFADFFSLSRVLEQSLWTNNIELIQVTESVVRIKGFFPRRDFSSDLVLPGGLRRVGTAIGFNGKLRDTCHGVQEQVISTW